MTLISDNRIDELDDKDYRIEFMQEMVRGWVSHQIKTLREQRGWTQQQLGEECDKPQATIGRLESPSYGRWTTATLLELAVAYDVALQIRFIPWGEFLRWSDDVSAAAMQVEPWSRSQVSEAAMAEGKRAAAVGQVVDETREPAYGESRG